MLEVSGKYNTAKIFTDVVDEASVAQVIELCSQPFAQGSRIRMMPDIHAGAGCTVGTTMTITDKIVPNLVGVDIGCGMETVCLRETHLELQKLDHLIQDKIPSGFAIRKTPHRFFKQVELTKLHCYNEIDPLRAEKSLGTLGGGNHFIEVDQDDEGKLYLIVHSGSRHLGLEVANFYQEEAYRQLNGSSQRDVALLIQKLKDEGRTKEISKAVKALKNTKRTDVPRPLAYAQGELFTQYVHDMVLIQQFALISRQAMADEILRGMKLHAIDSFSTIHNYLDTEKMVLRKGAVSAKAGERLLIPINMRDGSLICIGKGNIDWNESAPHGAGRLMSRSAAKQSFTVSEYKKQMLGIYTSCVGKSTLDECPMAYKPMEALIENIAETVTVERSIRPIYNFKAGEEISKT